MRKRCSVYNKADHSLTCGEALSYKYVPYEALAGLLIIRLDVIIFHPPYDTVQYHLVVLDPKKAVFALNDVMGTSRIKSRNDLSLFVSGNRELGFVSVTEWLIHPYDRFKYLIKKFLFNFTDTTKIVIHLILLELKLCLIAHLLKLTSSAASRDTAFRFLTVSAFLQDLYKSRKAVILFNLSGCRQHRITYDSILYEPDKAVSGLTYSQSFTGKILYFYCKLLIFIHFLSPMAQ